jgi:hypothetical protein
MLVTIASLSMELRIEKMAGRGKLFGKLALYIFPSPLPSTILLI